MAARFTLVIPTYNEAEVIQRTINTTLEELTSRCPCPWQIIVADNASRDGTADMVENLHDSRVSVIRLPEKGRGRAIRAAFRAAGGGIVAFTDVDLPIEFADIMKGLALIISGEYEIVAGTRFALAANEGKRSWVRSTVSNTFRKIVSFVVGIRETDSQCPLKMMNERTTPIMLATEDTTWWSEFEFLLLAKRLHIPVKELPVTLAKVRYPKRASKVRLVHDSLRAAWAVLTIRFHIAKPLRTAREALAAPTQKAQ